MLVGRQSERRVIEGLVAGARVGESGVLVLTGEAGIGKTTLLEDAAELAVGMRLLRATGTEAEREVAFGALFELLRPALGHLDSIPAPQADALATALALRSRAAQPASDASALDRFAVGAATLSLLSRYAEDRPLAVLVDDAHLLDRPSAESIAFAARRLRADPVLLLAAFRRGEQCLLADVGLPTLDVGGLGVAAASELVAARHRGQVPADLLLRLHEVTGGNPLALLELAADVDALARLPEQAPVPVPESLVRRFSARTSLFREATRTALLVVATSGGELRVSAAACAAVGADITDLVDAESAGVLRLTDDRAEFAHPLVRAAVYGAAAPALRRDVHRALAAALPAEDLDRRAWHLAEASLGPDEVAAACLEELGARSRRRGAHAVAANAFERAAALSPDDWRRVARLVEAGEAAWHGGEADRAAALLARVDDLVTPAQRTGDGGLAALVPRVAELRGSIAARSGSLEEARDVLQSAAEGLRSSDPDAALVLLADTLNACFYLGDAAHALGIADSALELLDGVTTERARILGTMAVGITHVLAGRGGAERVRTAVELLATSSELDHDERRTAWLVLGPLFLREAGTGRQLVQRVVDELRERTAVGVLPWVLFHLARDDATTDRWPSAEALYTESIALAREAGESTDQAASLAGLAWLLARQGREEECRRLAEEAAQLCERHAIHLFRAWTGWALGDLELALGRPDAALSHLQALAGMLDRIGVLDVDLSPAPEIAEALLREGLSADAAEAARGYEERAAAKGQPWALARAARTLGMLAPDAAIDDHFGRAIELHDRTLDDFERARTRLLYGGRLRRARRRVDARAQLRPALAEFDRLGATPWADAAETELRATGETAHRRDPGDRERLTPQELQVAQLLASGRTTREAAAALFLSPKTVEYHLRHVYTKLAITSRPELADAVQHLLA